MKPASSLTCAVLWLCAAGCFESTPASDAGTSDAGSCTSFANSGSNVQPTSAGTAPAPAAMGGALAAGDYHLQSSVYYPSTPCAPAPLATSLRVTLASASSGTIETVTTTAAGDTVKENVRFTTAGALLMLRLDCVSPDTTGLSGTGAVIPYTADAGMILLTSATPTCGTSIDTYVME